ncbi:uncharacterized protein LOC135138598 [Zophobas morio]|uniref:uncharacterized protein LOC135138598 n=1 Tax=Zophobas morio TaxID=2755281 RepID=UPI003083472B
MNFEVSEEIAAKAEKTKDSLLLLKSRQMYEKKFKSFNEWKGKISLDGINETGMMTYFQDLFIAFLQQKSKGYSPKKSQVLTGEQVLTFVKDAPDETHLSNKVILVIGVFGALRKIEVVQLTIENVIDKGSVILVQTPKTKIDEPKSFTIMTFIKLQEEAIHLENSVLTGNLHLPSGIAASSLMVFNNYYNLRYYPEIMLSYAGLHPYFRSKLLMFYNHYVNCSFFTFLLLLAIVEVALWCNRDTLQAIEGLSSVLFMLYTFCRYIISYYNKPILEHLLQNQSKFWGIANLQGSIREECEYIFQNTSNFIRYYKNYAVILAAVFYIQPFIFHELQMKIYVPEGWFYFLYAVYWYMTPPLFVSVYGVTSLFCALSVPAVIQFKLLAHRFETLQTPEKLKDLVDYHNFLIKYCSKINTYFSATLLFEFFITVSVCCILIFICVNDYPFVDKVKYIGFIVSQFLDTAIYCYTAELVTEASEKVSNIFYNQIWYNFEESSISKQVIFVISRAQKKILFSGYGIVWINMMTFTQVFKVTMSFVSYLNAVTM